MSPCQSLMRSEFMTSGPRCIPGWAHVAFNATLVSWPWPCFNGRSLATKETLLMKIRAQKRRLKKFFPSKLDRKDFSRKCFRMWNTMARFAGWNATSPPLRRATEERSWATFGGPGSLAGAEISCCKVSCLFTHFSAKVWGMFMWTSLT